jgi:hypothetical protein
LAFITSGLVIIGVVSSCSRTFRDTISIQFDKRRITFFTLFVSFTNFAVLVTFVAITIVADISIRTDIDTFTFYKNFIVYTLVTAIDVITNCAVFFARKTFVVSRIKVSARITFAFTFSVGDDKIFIANSAAFLVITFETVDRTRMTLLILLEVAGRTIVNTTAIEEEEIVSTFDTLFVIFTDFTT